ncbi:MAG: hypothetical protein HZA89_11310 [Verrucomicrobia bacterium]|nr:hypothetical protein [Verrucomicrobiota bacterium]
MNKPAPSLKQRLADLEKSNPVPKHVADTVMACLDKNPSKRPQSAMELAGKLGLGQPTEVLRSGPRQAVMAGLVTLALAAGVSEWARQKHDPAAETKSARVVTVPVEMNLAAGHTLLSEDFQSPDETGLPAGWSWGNLAKRTTGFPAWSETRRDETGQLFVRIAGVDEREAAFVERRLAIPFGIQNVRVTARMRPTGVPPPNPALESAAGFVCLWERSAPLGFADSVAGYAVVEAGAGWNDYTLTLTNVPSTARALAVRLGFNLATGILDVAHVKVEAFGDLEKIRRSAAVFAPQPRPLFFENYEEANAQGNPTRWGIKIVDPSLEFAEHSGIVEEGGRKFFRQTPGANQTNLWMNEVFPFKPSSPVVEFSALHRLKNVRPMNEDGATMRPLKVFFRNDEAINLSVYQLLWFDLDRPVNTDWTRLTRRLVVPPGTTQIRLLFGFQNTAGTFDVDDVQVRALE